VPEELLANLGACSITQTGSPHEPERMPDEGYDLMEDLADKAISGSIDCAFAAGVGSRRSHHGVIGHDLRFHPGPAVWRLLVGEPPLAATSGTRHKRFRRGGAEQLACG
jgi:hypothetical protein